jgi:hypothetical protein
MHFVYSWLMKKELLLSHALHFIRQKMSNKVQSISDLLSVRMSRWSKKLGKGWNEENCDFKFIIYTDTQNIWTILCDMIFINSLERIGICWTLSMYISNLNLAYQHFHELETSINSFN